MRDSIVKQCGDDEGANHGGDTRVVLLLLNFEETYLSRWLELRHCTRHNCRVKSEGCGAVDIICLLSDYRTFVGINHFHGTRYANVSAGSQVLTSIPFPSFTYVFLYIPFRKNRNKRMTTTSGGCHRWSSGGYYTRVAFRCCPNVVPIS